MRARHSREDGRRFTMPAAAALALSAALLLAGCGSSAKSGGKAKVASASSVAFSASTQACLKEHGLSLPAHRGGHAPGGGPGFLFPREGAPPAGTASEHGAPPSFAAGSAQRAKLAKALKACGVKFPVNHSGASRFRPPNTSSAAFRKQVTEYVACIRKHGYDMPEPNFSGKGPVFSSSEVNRESATYRSASAACSSLLRAPARAG